VERLRAGKGAGAVFVIGEPGMGKSVLVAEALARAQAEGGLRTVHASASEVEKTTPYFVWRTVFAALLGEDGDERLENVRSLLADQPDQAQLPPLLDAVLPLGLSDTPLTAQMSGEVRADNTRELLLTLLTQIARSESILIALEDAQWFDSASWAL